MIQLTNRVLRNKAKPVDFLYPQALLNLSSDMLVLMYVNGGCGLAAPQVGISKRLFVMDIDSKVYRCFNPKVIDSSAETSVDLEGCLSLPGLQLEIERAKEVTAQWHTSDGVVIEERLSGLAARCFQHELDHLNGITIIERTNGTTEQS